MDATTDFLPCLEIQPSKEPADAAVIWMHGLGATADDFYDVPAHLGLPADARIRFVFPQAPNLPVTLNGGMVMPAWYDISELGGWRTEEVFQSGRGQDRAGVERSAVAIRRLIDREVARGVRAERIVIGGFSQGGALSLHLGLRHPQRLGGIMVLSAGLMFAGSLPQEAAEANRRTPIFMAHGTFDPMIACSVGERSRDVLQAAGYDVEWRQYPMEHSVVMPEIQDIGRWLAKVLAPG